MTDKRVVRRVCREVWYKTYEVQQEQTEEGRWKDVGDYEEVDDDLEDEELVRVMVPEGGGGDDGRDVVWVNTEDPDAWQGVES